MLHQNDRYEIPEEILEMSHEEIKIELEKERQKMKIYKTELSKQVTHNGIKFNFD